MKRVLLITASLLLSACDSPAQQESMVLSSDPALRALAGELLPDLARRSGLTLRRPVRLERRSRAQLESYLRAKLDEELPGEEARFLTRSYALLGLVPPELDLRALLLSVYTEQVAGFYDPDSTALFVLDDQPAEALATVLVHELVHAVQDQAEDLDAITAKERGNDRRAAAQAAIEGHATLVMLEYMMERLQGSPVDLSQMDGFAGQLRPALEGVRAQYPMLAGAPRVIQESLLFPYLEGAGFLQWVWRETGDRWAPLGDALPTSTEQILHPERFLGPRDEPRDVELSVPGARILYSDGLGELETRLVLSELGDPQAIQGAVGWGGDRYALLESSAGEGLVWVTVWDDEASRDRFLERLAGRLDRFATVAAVAAEQASGEPLVVLRLGAVPALEIRLVDRLPEAPSRAPGTRP